MQPEFINGLNNVQKEITLDIDNSYCVLAGPGSGKTKLLTSKIAYLFYKGIKLENILSITFTNKAANEMKNRVIKLTNNKDILKKLKISTFHSLGLDILRKNISKINYKSNFLIYDDSDSRRLIESIIKDHNLDINYDKMYKKITSLKDSLITPEIYQNLFDYEMDFEQTILIYENYEKLLKENNSFDFSDLIIKAIKLLEDNQDVQEKYKEKYKYILVDEFQDTNESQYKLLKLLTKNKLFVVGDPDQSIYGWRGADKKILENLQKDFPNIILKEMSQNYRSKHFIIEAANDVIKNNVDRYNKKIWIANKDKNSANKITHRVLPTEKHEAEFIALQIKQMIETGNYNYDDFAILYRNNEISRVIEEYFVNYKIPYQIVGGLKFFQRKEIKDAISYLKAIYSPDNDSAILRIINYPKRNLGDITVQKVRDIATKEKTSLWSVIQKIESYDSIKSLVIKRIVKFRKIIEKLINFEKENNINDTFEKILKDTKLIKTIKKEDINTENKINNINELKSFLVNASENSESLEEVINSIILLEADDFDPNNQKVRLMTIHAAKGLEFKVVFIVGLEEDIFPTRQAIINEEISEERRLMYVAITRAKETLFVTNVKSRLLYGIKKANPQSRFLLEINDKNIERDFIKFSNKNKVYDTEQNSEIKVNDEIEHEVFGIGVVTGFEGEGKNKLLSIKFSDGKVKKLLAYHPKLTIKE